MEEKKTQNEKFMTVAEVAAAIEEIAPVSLQEEWDNSGLTIGFESEPVVKIMTCLEINDKVAKEAVRIGANMIITHHPLIFSEVKTIRDSSYMGHLLMDIIANRISVYSCHTPFDKVKGGNNDIVAELLQLTSVKNLSGKDVVSPSRMALNMDEGDIGRMGRLKKNMSCMQFIAYTAERLGMSIRDIRAVGDLDTEISKAGICTGAGADLLEMASEAGCQIFITGDVRYHQAQSALEKGICLIDAGHYGTERFFAAGMKKKLEKKIGNNTEVTESTVDINPFKTL